MGGPGDSGLGLADRPLTAFAVPVARLGDRIGQALSRPGVGRVVRGLVIGLAVGGFAVTAEVLARRGIAGAGGVGGVDALAYWAAGQHVLRGLPLYGAGSGTDYAFLYPPLFAQLLSPLTLLSPAAFVWLVRLLGIACLRLVLGSWVRAGVALLVFPPLIIELDYANVNLVVALACALATRGRGWLVPVTIAAKLAALPLVPFALVRDPRRSLISAGICGLAIAVSVALTADLWMAYVRFLAGAVIPEHWPSLSMGVPFAPRFALAALLGVASIRFVRLAPLAVVLANPVIWPNHLSVLIATFAPARSKRGEPGTVGTVEPAA